MRSSHHSSSMSSHRSSMTSHRSSMISHRSSMSNNRIGSNHHGVRMSHGTSSIHSTGLSHHHGTLNHKRISTLRSRSMRTSAFNHNGIPDAHAFVVGKNTGININGSAMGAQGAKIVFCRTT